ncbi:MAG: hypothetical protein IKD09_05170 [Lentisphaeria bacterium]|nr:hypothetical protein [Lentisphaeria bacterium]
MGTLSIIIGMIVFLTALFPYLGYMIIIPAAVGLIVGICKLCRDDFCMMALSGVVLNSLALILALFWTGILSFVSVNVLDDVIMKQPVKENIKIIYPMRIMDNHQGIPAASDTQEPEKTPPPKAQTTN